MVVAGIGVLPNQELPPKPPASPARTASWWTDSPDIRSLAIYAAGDVTRFTSPFSGASQRLESIQNANAQAESLVTADILGSQPRPRRSPGSGPSSTASACRLPA